MPLGAYLDLGGAPVAEALLGDGHSKGAMKSGTAKGIKLGPQKQMAGRHTDGDALTVTVQVCSRDLPGGVGQTQSTGSAQDQPSQQALCRLCG
jgi:hypothetical protein